MLVSFFDWMSAVYLSYLTVVHFFLLMISMQKPKKLLYCLFSSVEFIYFSSICFVLSVWQCVQLYPNTMGKHHMEHKLLSLSLSLAPLDLSVIRCRCTWISIFLRAVSFAVFVLQFLFLCLFTSLFMCFSVLAITSYVLGSINLSSPPHSHVYTSLSVFFPSPPLPSSIEIICKIKGEYSL